MSTTGRERGGYAKGRERRDAILAAANEVFATRGFRGASLATIAKRVGMSEPGLLHHFASKEELLLELLKLRDQHDDERIAQARAAHAHVPRRPARAVPPERGAARHRPPLHHPRGRERRRRPPRPRLVPRPLQRAPRHPRRPPGRRAARGHRRRRPRPRDRSRRRSWRCSTACRSSGCWTRTASTWSRSSRTSSRGCGRGEGRPPAQLRAWRVLPHRGRVSCPRCAERELSGIGLGFRVQSGTVRKGPALGSAARAPTAAHSRPSVMP